jgi:ABC-type glutathione transport system ATPase component
MSSGEFAVREASLPLLEVRDLTVDLISERNSATPILRGVSFSVGPGTIVGLFGESGCGKTTLALALLKLLPPSRYRTHGAVRIRHRDLLSMTEAQLERVRGAQISMVFQDPMLALNPVLRVRRQVAEVIRAHPPGEDLNAVFRLAGLAPSPRILDAYPHQLSGGERQRVAIAQALACRPALVIADEPFTAIDVTRVVELTCLFRDLKKQLGTSFLLISHSPGVLARIADQVLVMHAGRLVEQGTPRQVFESPSHAYTASLLQAIPRLRRPAPGISHGR